MNNYKFRGKHEDGRWRYGFYWTDYGTGTSFIKVNLGDCSIEDYEVDPLTVGQWSGETDSEGTEIYKGDELQRFKKGGRPYMNTKIVGWERGAFTNIENAKESKVISNIHDND